MLNTFKITTYLLLLFFTASAPVYAFSKLGHQVICQISFDHLSQTKQQTIRQLLTALPVKHQQLINRYNHKAKNSAISFAEACTWADAVKKQKEYKRYKSWHYVNVARDKSKLPTSHLPNNNVVSAITYHQQQLSAAKTSWNKLQALMFLGHWVADVHQPLHVSYRSDLGGNKTKISHSQCTNLHQYWDSCLLTATATKKNPRNKQALTQLLSTRWSTLNKNSLNKSSPTTWANESLMLIRQKRFLYCLSDHENVCKKQKDLPIKLPDSYVETFQPILEQRMLAASIRLHGLLERSL